MSLYNILVANNDLGYAHVRAEVAHDHVVGVMSVRLSLTLVVLFQQMRYPQ